MLLTWLAAHGSLKGQDLVFSQFYNAPIQLNPGLVGLSNDGQLHLNYRNQWPTWPLVYQSFNVSYDKYFNELNSGFGAQISVDDQGGGIIKTNSVTGVYAYQINLGKKLQARVGLEAGFIQTSLNWDKLLFGDQIVPGGIDGQPIGALLPTGEIPPTDLSKIKMDLSFGGLLYSEKFYIGLSLKHLNSPNLRFGEDENGEYLGLPSRLILHGGMQIDLDGNNKQGFGSFIAPSILFTQQSGLSQLNAGALYNQDRVFGGIWLRHNISNIDAAIVSVGLRTETLKLSYSFDLTLSDAFVTRTTGSHEIGIVMTLGRQNQESRYEDCFQIFR